MGHHETHSAGRMPEHDDVAVVPVPPKPGEWARRFTIASGAVARALPHVRVEHIGSTAVPDLPAKDVVDVLVGTPPGGVRHAASLLVDECFDRESTRDHHCWLAWPNRSTRAVVVHVVELDSPSWTRRLAFRDLLRRDPEARHRYLEVKREAAVPGDGWAHYTQRKAAIVARLLDGVDCD